MDINLEAPALHAVQSYNDLTITINNIIYNDSVFVNHEKVVPNIAIKSISELSVTSINSMIYNNPEIIVIGHKNLNLQLPITTAVHLANQRIGIECMSIGAACRTFNVLLSESRNVSLLIIQSN